MPLLLTGAAIGQAAKTGQRQALAMAGVWRLTGSMVSPHGTITMTRLTDGAVLAVSGDRGGGLTQISELYNPATGRWTRTGDVIQPRDHFGLVTLDNGQVLMAGGTDSTASTDYGSAELYNPRTGRWSPTGSLNTPRRSPIVIKLTNGEVLAASGAHGPPDGNRFLFTSELYNPQTGTWSDTPGNLIVAREGGDRAVLMQDGRVMLLGGEGPWLTFSPEVELYDPNTGTWTQTGSLPHGVSGSILVVLSNGRVLEAGGNSISGTIYADAYLYDPATGIWTQTRSMNDARSGATATLLSNGKILMSGGTGPAGQHLPSEIYNPKNRTWTLNATPHDTHNVGRQVTLGADKILLAGGYDSKGPTTIAELYRTRLLAFGSWPTVGDDQRGPERNDNPSTGPTAAFRRYAYPYRNAPACTDGGACAPDIWGFFQGQCTSWVAYRLNQLNQIPFTNSYGGPGTWGDAINWGRHARSIGIKVNHTPAIGSVAWYSSGHVAYVERVNSPTSIVISEMNYDLDNGFKVRTITTSHGWPTAFIHISDE